MNILFSFILLFAIGLHANAKKVTLKEMDDESFKALKARFIEGSIENVVKNDKDPEPQVRSKEIAEFLGILPLGAQTPNNYIFDVIAVDSGKKVGTLWYMRIIEDDQTEGFLYDIRIFEEFQNKGYGTALLKIYEEKAKEFGAKKVRLHVFGHNQGAKKLYTREGFFLTGYNMAKNLK